MSLPTRPLGTSGLDITRVGLGAWAIGGGDWEFGWGPQDDADSIAAMHRAVELGVNWIDTAAIYGHGHSEKVVGRFLKEIPLADHPYVFTKCGVVWDESDPMGPERRTLRPESIRRECEASLLRLGVERIDLYQIHWPDNVGTPLEDSWGTMSRLVEEGKIRAIGVSNYDVEMLRACEAVRHVDSLQPVFSLVRRHTGPEEIGWAAEHDTGVIVYSPMESGLLTDSFSRERIEQMAEGDWRRRSFRFQEPELSRILELRDAVGPIAERLGSSIADVAVAWTLAWPGVTGAIVGARSADQVDGWIGAASLMLSDDDLTQIAAAIESSDAGEGPARPS
jgi:aryl-alcohol dehydrogenase-like predicted oxidoreductase